MNKKGLALMQEFTLRMIIVLALIFLVIIPAISCGRDYFRLSERGQKDVANVFAAINELSNSDVPERKSPISVRLDKNTMFFGFEAGQEELEVKYMSSKGKIPSKKTLVANTLIFPRPKDGCNIEKDCFCFCEETQAEESVSFDLTGKYFCNFEDLTCIEHDDLYFSVKLCGDLSDENCIKSVTDKKGFLMFQELPFVIGGTSAAQVLTRAIYLERDIDGKIGICGELADKYDCIPPKNI